MTTNTMIHIFMCDDNNVLRTRYQNYITAIATKHKVLHTIISMASGEELISRLYENPNEADILYLDVLMGGMTGIETAKKLRDLGCLAEIVFLTSSEEYTFDSYEVNPLAYLLKDAASEGEKIEKTFLHAVKLVNSRRNDVLVCKDANHQRHIPIHQIAYVESKDDFITVHFHADEDFTFEGDVEAIDNFLIDNGFIRCHNDYIVSLKHIDTIESRSVVLFNDERIPLGLAYTNEVKLAFTKSLCEMF